MVVNYEHFFRFSYHPLVIEEEDIPDKLRGDIGNTEKDANATTKTTQ